MLAATKKVKNKHCLKKKKRSKFIFYVKLQVNSKELNCPLIIFKLLLGFLVTELFSSYSDNK